MSEETFAMLPRRWACQSLASVSGAIGSSFKGERIDLADNARLIRRIAGIACKTGREPVSSAEARQILGLPLATSKR